MGCSAKDYSDRCDTLDDAMKKTGLFNDKKYGSIEVYSDDAYTVMKSADSGASKADTIQAIIQARHNRLAVKEFREEMAERSLLEKLAEKY